MNERDSDQLAASVTQAGSIKRPQVEAMEARPGLDPADIRMIRQKLDKSHSHGALRNGDSVSTLPEVGSEGSRLTLRVLAYKALIKIASE